MSKNIGRPNHSEIARNRRLRHASNNEHAERKYSERVSKNGRDKSTDAHRKALTKNKSRHSIAIVCILALLTGVIVSFFTFFNVNNVVINGSSKYTKEQICSAGNIEIGDNLFFAMSSNDVNMLQKKLPYIYKVDVSRRLPSTLIIDITETEAFFAVYYENEYILLDGNMKILEKTSSISGLNIAEIKGVTPRSVVVGENMHFVDGIKDVDETSGKSDDVETNDSLVSRIVAALIEEKFSGVTCIDVTDRMSVKVEYMNRITIDLGAPTELQYKLSFANETIKRLGDGESGILDVSVPKTAYFKEYDSNE